MGVPWMPYRRVPAAGVTRFRQGRESWVERSLVAVRRCPASESAHTAVLRADDLPTEVLEPGSRTIAPETLSRRQSTGWQAPKELIVTGHAADGCCRVRLWTPW